MPLPVKLYAVRDVRTQLKSAVIRKRVRGLAAWLQLYLCGLEDDGKAKTFLCAMSKDSDAARVLNSLARESLHFLGSSDGPALADFLQDYFCGDDPTDSPGN